MEIATEVNPESELEAYFSSQSNEQSEEEPQESPEEESPQETPEVEPELEPESEPESEEPPQAEAEPEPVEDEVVEVDGRKVRKGDLVPFLRFAEWAKENPAAWQRMQGLEESTFIQGESTDTPAPVPEDEWIDPEDRIAALESRVSQLLTEKQKGSQAEFQAALSDAMEKFREEHQDVDDDGMHRMLVRLRDYNILASYRERNPARPVQAALNALEDVYKIEYYDRSPARQPITTSEVRARRKAASVVPTPITIPREEEVSSDPQERLKQIAEQIREAQHA